MQIHASTQSKAWKRGSDKKIAKLFKVPCCLSKMVGSLYLDAMTPADVELLSSLYEHVFSLIGERGSIKVYDAAGKERLEYKYEKRADKKRVAKGKTP